MLAQEKVCGVDMLIAQQTRFCIIDLFPGLIKQEEEEDVIEIDCDLNQNPYLSPCFLSALISSLKKQGDIDA
jgi:hypothetical protein